MKTKRVAEQLKVLGKVQHSVLTLLATENGLLFPLLTLIILFLADSMNGALAFVDTSDCTMMNIAEHYMASDVEWDPTGRFVVTSVSWWSHKVNFLKGFSVIN